MTSRADDSTGYLRRQVRLLLLLEAADKAGLSPLPVMRLHVLAYLSDVLSPVWNLEPFDGRVLKRQGGPFYPDLQHDLDRLVGRGLVGVVHVGHVRLGADRARIDGHYALNHVLAKAVLDLLHGWPEEARLGSFIKELMLSVSSMKDEDIERAFQQDATYSSARTGRDNVIEFTDWDNYNHSAAAAEKMGELVPTRAEVGPSEKLHLYVRHLRRRLHGGR